MQTPLVKLVKNQPHYKLSLKFTYWTLLKVRFYNICFFNKKICRNFFFFFHETDTSENGIIKSLENVEKYLIQVIKKKSDCLISFDKLRYRQYLAKPELIEKLPPTSNSIKLQILRAFFIVHTQTKCIETNFISLNILIYSNQTKIFVWFREA